MTLLDDLDGYEFEELMVDVFRKQGFENVEVSTKTGDKGRDILMEEVVNGRRRAVVVECKHTRRVGRPVVQKLHSAVSTYEYDGSKRGIIVTTGSFTDAAQEYAADLRRKNDPYPIECIDGNDLQEIADSIGLDLYNGRIEILCDQTLPPYESSAGPYQPVAKTVTDIENLQPTDFSAPYSEVTFWPVLSITADTSATFETSVGVIRRINDRTSYVIYADADQPTVVPDDVAELVFENIHRTIDVGASWVREKFDSATVKRFAQTETEYKDWALERIQTDHTQTVSYTGGNNQTYTKTCEPNQSNISIQSITPVYVPHVRQTAQIQQYTYSLAYHVAGSSWVTLEDEFHQCVQCGTSTASETYTHCRNCGSINCEAHIKTERLAGRPVCTGCAVTEGFMFDTKYFYSQANCEAFRQEYEAMALHEKAQENLPFAMGAVAAGVVGLLLFLSVLLSLLGLA